LAGSGIATCGTDSGSGSGSGSDSGSGSGSGSGSSQGHSRSQPSPGPTAGHGSHGGGDTHVFKVSSTIFEVDTKYSLIRPVGSGAYGVVISALDTSNGKKVAIKKIPRVFDDVVDAKRILREIRLLRQLKHENIINIVDILQPTNSGPWEDLYIVNNLMETDLHRIIYSPQSLSIDHTQYFVYQILRALKYMHSAGVVHRDLKPSNLLLNGNCDLKICDLGLARGIDEDVELTEYVVTRWYRAPEIMLACREYTKAVDLWSVGCIFGELLERNPLFPGDDYIDQLRKIIAKLGRPPVEDLAFVTSDKARRFILSLDEIPQRPLTEVYPNVEPLAADLLQKMLVFPPSKVRAKGAPKGRQRVSLRVTPRV